VAEVENMKNQGTTIFQWFLRFIKYNIIGVAVFLVTIALYYLVFYPVFGENAYVIVSIVGGVLQFTLISYFNRTKLGIMFESCRPTDKKQKAE